MWCCCTPVRWILRRMFAGTTAAAAAAGGNRPDSLTHAYTSMKLLSQRLGAMYTANAGPRPPAT
jgi:hypothetical protein